jgi:hypothetical protein
MPVYYDNQALQRMATYSNLNPQFHVYSPAPNDNVRTAVPVRTLSGVQAGHLNRVNSPLNVVVNNSDSVKEGSMQSPCSMSSVSTESGGSTCHQDVRDVSGQVQYSGHEQRSMVTSFREQVMNLPYSIPAESRNNSFSEGHYSPQGVQMEYQQQHRMQHPRNNNLPSPALAMNQTPTRAAPDFVSRIQLPPMAIPAQYFNRFEASDAGHSPQYQAQTMDVRPSARSEGVAKFGHTSPVQPAVEPSQNFHSRAYREPSAQTHALQYQHLQNYYSLPAEDKDLDDFGHPLPSQIYR